MEIIRTYKMTEKELKTFCHAYKRIHNVGWIEVTVCPNKIKFESSDENLTLLDIMKEFINQDITSIMLIEGFVMMFSTKYHDKYNRKKK